MAKPALTMASDLHLAHQSWASRPALWGDSYFALDQIIGYCVTNNTPLLLAGDILDSKQPGPETVLRLSQAMGRMELANLPVWYICGQHDRTTPAWPGVHPWPKNVDQVSWSTNGFNWYGLAWRPAGEINDCLLKIPPGTDAFMCHQVWEDLVGTQIRSECKLSEVPHVNLVLGGDYHDHRTLEAVGKSGQKLTFLSPGSTAQQAIDEPVKKQFFVLYDDGGSFRSEPLASRLFLRCVLSRAEEFDQFVGEEAVLCADDLAAVTSAAEKFVSVLPSELQKPAIWIKYDATIDNAYNRLIAAVGDKAHLFLSPIVPEASEHVILSTERRRYGGLLDALELVCSKDSPVYRDATRLLESTNPGEELATMRQECGVW